MRTRPEHLPDERILEAVRDGWGIALDELRYVPEGAGAYHWSGTSVSDGRRWFVTCDDLDTKPWLGSERDQVFAGLLAAYGSAVALRAAGAEFVVAPEPSGSGDPAVRLDDRHSVSVFAHVDGEPGRWGAPLAPGLGEELVAVLARLHGTQVPAGSVRWCGLELPGRAGLEEALGLLDRPWDAGPLAEPARLELRAARDGLEQRLAALDRVAAALGESTADSVLTHGEPHPGNLIRTAVGLALVDWDTVARSRPERDLWMLATVDPGLVEHHRELTGVALDPDALAAFRSLWALSDVVAYSAQLRRPHVDDADAERALAALRSIFQRDEPRPFGTG